MKNPVVAFYDIEADIHEKAKHQPDDLTTGDSSEGEDDDCDVDAGSIGRDREFLLDRDIDLESPFLYSMLSDERPVPGPSTDTTPALRNGARDSEPTDEEWENM